MFSTLDEQTRTTKLGNGSSLQRFARIAGIAVVTGILFSALYLGILLAE